MIEVKGQISMWQVKFWSVMISNRVSKICQRQLYTWLSSRRGIPVLVIGVLVIVISLLQFGGAFLEWSKERYAAQFSIYADNIVGKSYETYLCPTLPIDIVYTWVNGSDPILLAELKEIRKELLKKESGDSKNDKANASSCPFQHCTSWRALVIDAHNHTTHNPDTLTRLFPSLREKVVWTKFVNKTGDHVTSVFVVQLKKESDVKTLVTAGTLSDHHGNTVSVTEGYLTTDNKLVGGVKMEDMGLAVGDGIRPSNTSKLLRKWVDLRFNRQVEEVEVRGNQTAVLRFHSGGLNIGLATNQSYQLSGQPLHLYQAYLIWLPFSLPESAVGADQISASRFEDNEELRYSLRSVEQFAPWVRHIFLITNGQIPFWLNLENPRLTIITHEEIFPNKTHLPTYSSPAIEAHIHRIPGLSENFIYLNDDVMFGEEVWPEDFYTPQRGQKVFLSWPVPQCAEGCPSSWITDKFCDRACNNSACEWDGGDCANVSRPGPVGGAGGGWSFNANNKDVCSTGCLNNWLGDRYCDSACRTPECGFDAGDCGADRWGELLSYEVNASGTHYNIPLGTKALFFNLSAPFFNATFTSAEHTPSDLIRTAVLSKKLQSLSFTLAKNMSLRSVNVTVCGKVGEEENKCVNFSMTGDTLHENMTLLRGAAGQSQWNFNFTDTHSQEFLRAVATKAGNLSVDTLPTVRPPIQHTLPPPTVFPNLTVTNSSLLPQNLSQALTDLEKALKDGDLTLRGYWIKKVAILEAVKHIIVTNGTIHIGAINTSKNGSDGVKDNKNTPGAPSNQQFVGGARRLLTSHDFLSESRRRLPWEKWYSLPEPNETIVMETPIPTFRTRKLLGEDYFANSLKHVNRLYTQHYGHTARKVPAHMPHFIQRSVMEKLQEDFKEEFEVTSSHNVRASNDMQFAFSYFYYLMSEKQNMVLEDVFKMLDTDRSGILSVRELRTLMSMLSDLPIELKHVESFQSMLESCDRAYNGTRPSVEPIEYETHYDPDLPLVTLDFVRHCKTLLDKLKDVFKTKPKYKFEEVDEKQYVIFQMVSENGSTVMDQLDHIRRDRKKFICLNDNIDHSKKGADLAKLILLDFYETFFPIPSQFELPPQYQNRFLRMRELREWLKYRDYVQLGLYLVCGVLLLLCIVSLFYGKLVQWKRRTTRYFSNCLDRRTPV